MSYEVTLTHVDAQPTAAVRACVPLDELAQELPKLFDKVYGFLRRVDVGQLGQNVVLYFDEQANLEASVQVPGPFVGADGVHSSSTPEGRVATTIHTGPYSGLPSAHDAVRRWCAEQGHELAGPNWEVYGDWYDDPSKVQTQVFYLLKQ
jgi:effector-binding domain-containing protein